jgi:N-ethylmaleimide reductase
MAPMTRSRAGDTGVPCAEAITYYQQRAEAGLIITEGTFPSAMGKGYLRTPGIHAQAQIAAWRKITDAVHERGGLIFVQLMHCGRISHPALLPDSAIPVAPSALKPEGKVITADGLADYVLPRELDTQEIAQVIGEYQQAAKNAHAAGFDGIELHAASGYLPEQFLSSGSNRRTDRYGGSVLNRVRFTLELLEALGSQIGADRIGVKIAPELGINGIFDAAPLETYRVLAQQIRPLKLAYLHVAAQNADYHAMLMPLFEDAYLVGRGLTQATARSTIETGRANAAVFGSQFLANPDLVRRFAQGAALNEPDRSTFYTPGPRGYIDYPTLI